MHIYATLAPKDLCPCGVAMPMASLTSCGAHIHSKWGPLGMGLNLESQFLVVITIIIND